MARAPNGPLLRADSLSAGFGRRCVLNELNFSIPHRGIYGILGPSGVGKSTLLRTFGRWNEPLPSFWVEGAIHFNDENLLEVPVTEAHRRVGLLSQKARLYTATILDNAIAELRGNEPLGAPRKREIAHQVLDPLGLWNQFEPLLDEPVISLPIGVQRKLSLARLCSGGADCLLVDEPLRDISKREANDLRDLLELIASGRVVVMVTHNQQEARGMCETICLITAGRIAETTPAREFFREPRTALGREFIRSGNCWPITADSTIRRSTLSSRKNNDSEKHPRPGGFHWIIVGLLGGAQQPGLLQQKSRDFQGLEDLGCQVLVNLRKATYPTAGMRSRGIRSVHFPIDDMGVPSLEEAADLCTRISAWIDKGLPTVLHCKAGLGRTGTLLACALIHRGENAVRAIDQIRAVNLLYIQSEAQLDFVSDFEVYLRHQRSSSS